jgi:ABC-type Na+ transport system ATPase subunit NatA
VDAVCDRAIILHNGRMVYAGDAKDSLAEYVSRAYMPDEEED